MIDLKEKFPEEVMKAWPTLAGLGYATEQAATEPDFVIEYNDGTKYIYTNSALKITPDKYDEYQEEKARLKNYIDLWDELSEEKVLKIVSDLYGVKFYKETIPELQTKECISNNAKCECGADSCGFGCHSDWCPKGEKENV